MMETLKDRLSKFRDKTVEIMLALKYEDYIKTNSLLDERHEIIQSIEKLQYDNTEFAEVCNSLGIEKLDGELNELLSSRRIEVMKNIDNIISAKNARSKYLKKSYMDSMFLNKKL
jgi:hypothetical protein